MYSYFTHISANGEKLIAPKTKIFHVIQRNFPCHRVTFLYPRYLSAFLNTSETLLDSESEFDYFKLILSSLPDF